MKLQCYDHSSDVTISSSSEGYDDNGGNIKVVKKEIKLVVDPAVKTIELLKLKMKAVKLNVKTLKLLVIVIKILVKTN